MIKKDFSKWPTAVVDFSILFREEAHNKLRANGEASDEATGDVDYFPNTLHLAELEQWAIRQALTVTKGKAMKAALW